MPLIIEKEREKNQGKRMTLEVGQGIHQRKLAPVLITAKGGTNGKSQPPISGKKRKEYSGGKKKRSSPPTVRPSRSRTFASLSSPTAKEATNSERGMNSTGT